MARGWKDTYEASRCDHCGAQVQRRTIAGTDERITLEAYRERCQDGYIITAELEAKAGQCCGEAYRVHRCTGVEAMRNTISNIR